MALSRQELRGYDAMLRRQEAAAAEYVRRRLEAWMAQIPGASVAEMREYAASCVADAATAYGDAASSIAADLYDELARRSGDTLSPAVIDTSDVRPYIEKEARWQAGKLVDGALTGFIKGMSACAFDQVSRRANQTMRLNASRDGLRYARVPMGAETCTFCAMLASRGYVYRSRALAGGEGNHYHANCRCKVVPETAGTVEGYDPVEWAARWHAMREVDADGSRSTAEKLVAKKEIATGLIYSRISGSHDVESDLASTNPGYRSSKVRLDEAVRLCSRIKDSFGLASDEYRAAYSQWSDAYNDFRRYSENCQRCVVAYEMRRRGYNVEVLPRILDNADLAASHWRDFFKGAKWEKVSSEEDADESISRMPIGARGTVYIVWERKSDKERYHTHVFNFEKTEAGIFYRDAQTGKIDVRSYFSRKAHAYDVEIARTDNLEVNESFADMIFREVGSNG